VEKRVCEYPDDDYDPTTVPVIWKSWLQGARENPPSEADMAMCVLMLRCT
jgi:NADH:ubiquinone oxidoreductase subunit